ncbi:DUF7024 domain-containing protein, partial [Yersinia massiliensis]|uniref:DUF7024 domain-containing protein n=1 Tax=Yersinia massiliensis TaxID=419257 RepID=UPI0037048829
FLTDESNAHKISEYLNKFSLSNINKKFECRYFVNPIGRYVICDFVDSIKEANSGDFVFNADFSNHSMITKGMVWSKGLSTPEAWGRWSDSNTVIFKCNCLAAGEYKIYVKAHAFGPNIDKPMLFTLGSGNGYADFQKVDSNKIIRIKNQNECADELVINIPSPVSPAELGMNGDGRTLGIGLVGIKIFKE